MTLYEIPLGRLWLAALLIAATGIIYARWTSNRTLILNSSLRMAVQLFLIGFALNAVFSQSSRWVVYALLGSMVCFAAIIAFRSVHDQRQSSFLKMLAAIALGGGLNFWAVTSGILVLDPALEPRYSIPLAGMIFAGAMNSVSLAAERFDAETGRGADYIQARATAFRASLIPVVNTFFAVGLVSLPGMMTGQILAGVSPFIACRYQIMVMGMLMGSSGISAAIYLVMLKQAAGRAKS